MASLEGRRDREPKLAEPADSRTHVDDDSRAWARQAGPDTLLHLHVRPGAKVAAVMGPHNGRLKIAIDAPPVEGKANAALLEFLASILLRPQRELHLQRGATGRDKIVRVERAEEAEIVRRLASVGARPRQK